MTGLIPNPPEGLEAFWSETAREALDYPLDFEFLHGIAYPFQGFSVQRYRFRSIVGTPLNGWIAVPREQGPFPAFLWIPPYGRESLLPNAYGTREGFVSSSLNFFGHDAFHQERYVRERGYFAEGVLSERTWIMRRMFQNAVLAGRVLRSHSEVHIGRIGVLGMSQGGGFAIWLGAWIEWIGAVCADMPFLGGVSQTLGGRIYRYPLKELVDFAEANEEGLNRVRKTLSFFDTLNVATYCRKPILVSLGEKDPAVRPQSVESIFQVLPQEKELFRYPVGHDWYPAMIENNRKWLLDHLQPG